MKVWLRTFGCRANHYDTEAVRALVERNGHVIVDRAEEADVAIFNSCAVTTDAVADLRQGVRRAARENPGLRSVIMGCASALPEGADLAALPTVDCLVAGADLQGAVAVLGTAATPIVAPERGARTVAQAGARALLRIQDGCDEHCTFCATTIARGANRSRPMPELVEEASMLAARHPEIVITGVHIGTWGHDLRATLGELLERLVGEVPAVRFRLTSIEATEVDDRILGLMAASPSRLAPQIHAPLQSGSDRVLKRMGRHWYTAAAYRAAIERMSDRLPVFGLGADIITGFPGETEDDHAATRELVEVLPFTYLHVFPYSARPGTAATRLDGQVPAPVARRRATELRAIGQAKAEAYARRRAGAPADVVVIGGAPRRGLTEDYLEIRLPDGGPGRGERLEMILAEADEGGLCGLLPSTWRSDAASGAASGAASPAAL